MISDAGCAPAKATPQMAIRIAILLCTTNFEEFFGKVLNLSRDEYIRSHRNDWSFLYAHALRSEGISTVIYTPSRGKAGLQRIDDSVAVRFLSLATLWRRVPLLSRTPPGKYFEEVANSFAFISELVEKLRIDDVDILCVQEYWTGRFDHISHRVPIPVVGIDQGGRSERQIKWFKRASFSRAAALICQSAEEIEAVHSWGGKGVLLPNGIDTTFFSPHDSSPRERWVLTVARLTDKQKRTSDLIRALALLPESWELKIAGVGPDEKVLRKLAHRLHVDERVKFVGFIREKSALRELYRRCGVFALPSANEGLALAALEAMSCGCSCVVSDIRAFKDVIHHQRTGLVAPVGDVEAIAAAIEAAWDSRQSIGLGARAVATERYSETVMANRLASLFRTVIEQEVQSSNRS